MIGSAKPQDVSPLLEAVRVRKSYHVQTLWVGYASILAVEGVSVQAWEGRTLAIAGESGCGKSTLGRMLLGLVPPDEGEIRFAGCPLSALAKSDWRQFHRSVQMVFQNALRSFNPMLTVGGTITDAMRLRNDLPSLRRKYEEAERWMGQMGLDPSLLRIFPAETSAGHLQKASIARALAAKPKMIFLDEPTSALDGSGRRQMTELLLTLQSKLGIGYVLISHDFHVIRKMAHYVAVMYLGQIVEEGPAEEVLSQPMHPYTRALLTASFVGPTIGSARQSQSRIRGELSKLPAGYQGCRLFWRCAHAVSACVEMQPLIAIRPQHSVRCWRAEEIASERSNFAAKDNQS